MFVTSHSDGRILILSYPFPFASISCVTPDECERDGEQCGNHKWWCFDGTLLREMCDGGMEKWAAMNELRNIFLALEIYDVVSSLPKKRQKENKKEAKNFPIWFTFYVLKLPRFPYDERTGGRWDDTFRNLHLLFGNHAWICIYLHLYFIHNVRGGKKKESAEMFISLRFFSASRLPSTGLRWWFFHLIFLHSVHAGMSNKSFPQSWWQDSGWLRQSFGTTEISAGRKLWIMSVVRYMRVQREFLN